MTPETKFKIHGLETAFGSGFFIAGKRKPKTNVCEFLILNFCLYNIYFIVQYCIVL